MARYFDYNYDGPPFELFGTGHLISLAVIYVLLTRNYRVYEIVFFLGIAGASQTLVTPEAANYGLPHFRAIQTLWAHGMIVIALFLFILLYLPFAISDWMAGKAPDRARTP